MKLSSSQLFVVALVALGLLAGAAYLDRTYLPVLVGILIGTVQVFVHISGVNTGVPLSPQPTALPAVLESTQASASAATIVTPHSAQAGANG